MASRLSALALLLLAAAPAPPPANSAAQLTATARARLATGDFAGALQASDRAVALYPRDADALLLASNLVRDRYGLTAALPWYDRVIEIAPNRIDALIDKAATLGDAGRSVEMLAVTRRILVLDPKQPMAFYLQAVLAARAGRWELARGLLYRCGGQLDTLPAMAMLRGAIALNTGADELAIAALRPLLAAQPGNRHARRLLGLALLRSGDDQGAIDALGPISDDADAWAQLVMARACDKVGDRLGAAILRDRAADPSAKRRGWQGGGAGDALMAAGRWHDAAAEYTQSANLRFTPPVALRLIDALGRAGDGPAAGQVLETLITQFPASLPALRVAAADALARGEWGRAMTALELLRMRTGEGDAAMLGNLAWAQYHLGHRDRARSLIARARAIAPASPALAAEAAWVHAH